MNREDFLKPEIRCGYNVDVDRKKLWLCELDIMSDFVKVCEKHELTYFLIAGSAIGAVRHKGFIPWDDDLDIGMFRSDFDKFLELADKELSSKYTIEYGLLKPGGFSFLLRIRDDRTTGIVRDEFLVHRGGGIFIEIYPFDEVPHNNFMWKLQRAISSSLAFMIGTKGQNEEYSGWLNILKKISNRVSLEVLWKAFNKNCRKYNGKKTGYVNRPATPQYAKKVGHYRFEQINETISVPFEFTNLNIQKDYDYCLKQMYGGDYMSLPPIQQRGSHHEKIVFYDPDHSYTEYLSNDDLYRKLESYFF